MDGRTYCGEILVDRPGSEDRGLKLSGISCQHAGQEAQLENPSVLILVGRVAGELGRQSLLEASQVGEECGFAGLRGEVGSGLGALVQL